MSYIIVTGLTIDELVTKVNDYIKQNYEPLDGFRTVGVTYAQTMYLKKAKDTEHVYTAGDVILFNKLKNKRKELSDKIGAPAYIVATNRMLESLIEIKPKSKEELSKVYGFGEQKIQLYGEEFINVLRS